MRKPTAPHTRHTLIFLVLAAALVAGLVTGLTACRPSAEPHRPLAHKTFLSQDGLEIRYDVSGDPHGRITVMLIHGWCNDKSYWRHQLPVLNKTYQVVTVDLAGHGESEKTREDWTMAAFAADVSGILAALDLYQVILVGHSMGGAVILETARQNNGRILGVVGIDTFHDVELAYSSDQLSQMTAPFRENFETAMKDMIPKLFAPGSDPDLARSVADDMARSNPAMAIQSIENYYTYDFKAPLRQIRVPVRAINQAGSPYFFANNEAAGKKYNPGFEIKTISGAGHYMHLEAPESVTPVLLDTLTAFTRG